jgi:hypothetical protein
LYRAANAVDANVIGVAVLGATDPVQPHWYVTVRPDGLAVRVDTADGDVPSGAAIEAIAGLDISEAATDARRATDDRAAALTLLTRSDPTYRLIRGVLLTVMDELNELRRRDRERAADIASATSLADLRNKTAARAALTDRTAAQLRSALSDRTAGDN